MQELFAGDVLALPTLLVVGFGLGFGACLVLMAVYRAVVGGQQYIAPTTVPIQTPTQGGGGCLVLLLVVGGAALGLLALSGMGL